MEGESPSTAPQPLVELTRAIEQHNGFPEVVAELLAGGQATIDGAVGSSCALAIAGLASRTARPLVVV
jgi:hypothetical protein